MKHASLLLVSLLFLSSQPALAAGDSKPLGTFGGWSAYSFTDNGKKVCFMSLKPAEQKGNFKKRGDVLLFITRWPEDKLKNVITVSMGYPYQKGGEAVLSADGKTFTLATSGEMASSKDQSADDDMTTAIRKSATLKIDGVSVRGTKTTDTYDLKGADAAFSAISKECDSKQGETKP
jgi:hypothetical protein